MTSIWYSIILVGFLTFLTRLSFIILSDKIKLPSLAQRGLRLVPIAVLSAIILPELVQNNGGPILIYLPRLVAGALAILVAWRTKNIIITILTGMIALYILNYFIF